MIENSFIFLERIGSRAEQRLWQQGIHSWEDFLNAKSIKGISEHRKSYYARKLMQAQNALYSLNSKYFINRLPLKDCWRLYPFFADEAVFLDIETAGLDWRDMITVIGLFDGINTKTMIHGINLDVRALRNELSNYKLLVTFNGASFDVPFLNKKYPGLLPAIPHLDLRFVCQLTGLTGGLKHIEKQFGIQRNIIVERMYGGDALRLWRMYRATGDKYYLNLLVSYNEEDVVNLKTIANHVVRKLSEQLKQNYFKNEY